MTGYDHLQREFFFIWTVSGV